MGTQDHDEVRSAVRKNYGAVALSGGAGCGCSASSCCGAPDATDTALGLGYTPADVASAPAGANLGLGCGNPQGIASLQPGETVLDLGSGGGFDCFLAARAVGDDGRVIGVDMTPEMITRSRQNASTAGMKNVDFRLGELENLPVADGSVDVIISNCVINLSPEKDRVFEEAFRVLAPGGRLAISDVVATTELPDSIRQDPAFYSGCVSGASHADDIEAMLRSAGFTNVDIAKVEESRTFISEWSPGSGIEDYVVSATIQAVKPRT